MLLKKQIFLFGCVAMLLVGCSNESAAEKMYNHLEETVAIEESFSEQDNQIAELEQKERDLYNEMIVLSMDEFDQIKELADEAIAVLDEKEELIDNEKESIEMAKEEFDNVTSLTDDLEEEGASSTAETLVNVMNERHEAYSSLYEAYKQAIEEDRKLYQMMQQEDVNEEDVTNQISTVNKIYDQVLASHTSFNDRTEEYNVVKKEFYDSAGLQVEYVNRDEDATESASN